MIMIGLFVDLSLIRTRLSKQNCLWGRHGLGCLALVRMVFCCQGKMMIKMINEQKQVYFFIYSNH